MTEQTQSKPEFVNMIYLGNTFFKKGTSQAGKDWTIHKLMLKVTMEDKFDKKWSVFTPLTSKSSLQIDTLIQGETYNFGIVKEDKPNNAGVMTTFTNVIWIGAKKEGQAVPTQTAPTQPSPQANTGLDLKDFAEFKVNYLNMVKSKNMTPTAVHMLGSFIATKEKDRVAELKQLCTDALK